MPKRTDIESILIIGAGPIVIGQACEFDYSGAQACKALKEEGYRVILVNSNPATIMTDPSLADATYVEPITPEMLEKIIEREKPDALLPTMGGQTGLNNGLTLDRTGVLARHGVEMIGAVADVIDKAEDRLLFREAMQRIGIACPRSRAAKTFEQALEALDAVGLPAIVRPSFTLGGTGGGIAYNREEYGEIVKGGLHASPVSEVLIEQSVFGWKEFEMEVVRDRADNCIIVCSIENIDPMGIHTGDSVTVAPALTLTDKEFQLMRDASIACLREIGVDTGGSNVQFAVNPDSGEMVIIEMNPRVSRSSALASKATGFPIAKVAAKLAVGYTLDELDNDITRVTPASFEPTIDYVVTKIPRFTFEKFPGAEPILTTSMKSVGEAMSIGRCFAESFQKALRSMETGLTGLNEVEIPGVVSEDGTVDREELRVQLGRSTPDRLLTVAQALRHGLGVDDIAEVTKIDPWFVHQVAEIVNAEDDVRRDGLPEDGAALLRLKKLGFSDARLAELAGLSEPEVADRRAQAALWPVYKRIDTCAGEFPSATPYMYSTYEDAYTQADGAPAVQCEADPSDRDKIIILGGGPNRIGQGIEFDYCCVHAAYALAEAGIETIMVNCNPETVSTDYDTSDRLYFEPLTAEDVIEIARVESRRGQLLGVIVQFGGQTPLKLSHALAEAGIPVLGTSPDAIDLAEDRKRFQGLVTKLGLRQPTNGTATSAEEARAEAARIGYPVLIRPSYVLGGRAMEIVHDTAQLDRYIASAVQVSGQNPVLIDSYLRDAIEVDVDAVADGEQVCIAGVMEHIEEAGIHSGDSACALPPHSLPESVVEEIGRQTEILAKALSVIGLMNVQFAVQNGDVYILEVNPRASRTVPFVAKATGVPIAKVAARIMAGARLEEFDLSRTHNAHVAVKETVFPFARFPGVDVMLGPEMKSTGEVMGVGDNFAEAYGKAVSAAGDVIPRCGKAFLSVRDADKVELPEVAGQLHELGFSLVATRGTAKAIREAGFEVEVVNKVLEGRPHIVDMLKNEEIDFIVNTTEGKQAIADSFTIRSTALRHKVYYTTTMAGGRASCLALGFEGNLVVRRLQELHLAISAPK